LLTDILGQKIDMSRKTIEVDSDTIDLALDELSKLIFLLDKNPKNEEGTKHD
jgi:hypothetical protein